MTPFAPLGSLQLSDAELSALTCQGFVSVELRGARRLFKLRFRLDGRQRVKSLGTDEARAKAIEANLRQLQSRHRQELEAKQVARSVAQGLKDLKRRLGAIVEAEGFRFHGNTIRKPRPDHVVRRQLNSR